MTLWNDLASGWRYARGLAPYMHRSPVPGDPVADIRAQLAGREAAFLDTLHRGVFAQADSPYSSLLSHAQVTEGDIVAAVHRVGIEATLRQLYEAGVYVTLDEFKGRTPIVRPGLELPVKTASFDNPLSKGQLQGVTGGSRTHGTRVLLDLDDLAGEFSGALLWLEANDALGLPQVYWRPAAPSTAALKWILVWARLGTPVVRWWSQTMPGPRPPGGLKGWMLQAATVAITALSGHPTPFPRYVSASDGESIVRWLAAQTRRGVRVYIDAIVSSAVRLCVVARELGLDMSGHVFRTIAEPLTPAKAMVLYEAGCDVISAYGAVDAGRLGSCCGTPNALDDMHLLTTRTGFLQVFKQIPGWPQPVGALYFSTLRPTAPKLLLNVESGDYGVMSERRCGCALGQAGLTTHLHTIRNYEKLTSAGMHFMGSDLLELLEVALPQRYGGHPTDYQFVETEEAAQTILKLVISPRVGAVDAAVVKDFVLRELERRTAGGRLMTDIWRDSDTLRIERSQPYTTGSAKIQPLHVAAGRIRPSS